MNSSEKNISDREPSIKFILRNSTVIKLGLISLFADIASEMLYPITPIFLTSVLGASMLSVGLIEGIAEGVASFFKVFSGIRSDKTHKRKPFIVFGYLLAALSKPLIGASTSWGQVLVARAMDRFGKGIRSAPRDAMLSEAVPSYWRGVAFGWHRAMDTLGAALGPLLALVLLGKVSNLRVLYYWALIPGFISVLIVLSLKENNLRSSSKTQNINWNFASLTPNFKKYLLSWTIFSLVNSSDVFLLLKAKGSGISESKTILLYAFYNLIYSLMSPYLGHLSDKWGRRRVLIGGLLIFASVYFSFTLAHKESHFWFLFGIYGLYMAATDGVSKVYVIDLVDPQLKGTGLGFLGMATSLSTVFASGIAGYLWDSWGSFFPFYYGSLGAIIAAMLLASFFNHK